ncbi:MAG: hypothetical protein GY858_04945 [Candidatus Omnitrophica bacterium]|nr:hypothetical protein [Candidatus Omnitrophota bacterium]
MAKTINKNQINSLLKEVEKEYKAFAPIKGPEGDVLFKLLCDGEVALGSEDVVISPKDIFFPQWETMFKFKDGQIEETCESAPVFLFGIRPCDLKGLLFADEFFKRDIEDKYYLSKIEGRFIVTIGCIKPPRKDACFCTSTDSGPFAKDGYDLQLVDVGESYLIEVGSKKGEEFIAKHAKFFTDSDADTAKTKEDAAKAVELKVDFKKALDLMADDKFTPQEIYERIGERCLYCGGCLYTCPTCTCFNVFDNATDGKGERVRNWDGCILSGYTREASGHNPRTEKWIRAARRYEHKLKHDCKVTEKSGCTGCGRCLSSCPVNIGMSKFIQEITEKRRTM